MAREWGLKFPSLPSPPPACWSWVGHGHGPSLQLSRRNKVLTGAASPPVEQRGRDRSLAGAASAPQETWTGVPHGHDRYLNLPPPLSLLAWGWGWGVAMPPVSSQGGEGKGWQVLLHHSAPTIQALAGLPCMPRLGFKLLSPPAAWWPRLGVVGGISLAWGLMWATWRGRVVKPPSPWPQYAGHRLGPGHVSST